MIDAPVIVFCNSRSCNWRCFVARESTSAAISWIMTSLARAIDVGRRGIGRLGIGRLPASSLETDNLHPKYDTTFAFE